MDSFSLGVLVDTLTDCMDWDFDAIQELTRIPGKWPDKIQKHRLFVSNQLGGRSSCALLVNSKHEKHYLEFCAGDYSVEAWYSLPECKECIMGSVHLPTCHYNDESYQQALEAGGRKRTRLMK